MFFSFITCWGSKSAINLTPGTPHTRPSGTMQKPEALPVEGSIDRQPEHPRNAESREFSSLLFQTQQEI